MVEYIIIALNVINYILQYKDMKEIMKILFIQLKVSQQAMI